MMTDGQERASGGAMNGVKSSMIKEELTRTELWHHTLKALAKHDRHWFTACSESVVILEKTKGPKNHEKEH